VVTGAPNFPKGEVYEGYQNNFYQTEQVDGIKVIRVWSYITANKGFVKRVLDYLSFSFMAFWVGLFKKADVFVATSPQFFTTWTAWALSKLKRKPWIFELRDLWPESIKTVGAMSDNKAIRLLERVELSLYTDSDQVIPNTYAFKTNLKNRGIDGEKIKVIPNGSNLELFQPREPDQELLKDLHLEDKFVIGYIGTHGMAHSLDFILHSVAKLQKLAPEVHFLFIGDGAEKKSLQSIAKNLGLNNVTFHDPVPKEQIPAYLSITGASLVPLKKADTFKTVIPSKIFEAAAMKVPILLGVEGQAQEIVNKYGAGLCFEPENEEDFINRVLMLKNDPELCAQLGENGLDLAHAFDRKKLAEEMLEIIYEVGGERLTTKDAKENRKVHKEKVLT